MKLSILCVIVRTIVCPIPYFEIRLELSDMFGQVLGGAVGIVLHGIAIGGRTDLHECRTKVHFSRCLIGNRLRLAPIFRFERTRSRDLWPESI